MKPNSKTRLFLIELVIIILFFAFAGAICANIFVKAHTISQDSSDLSEAVLMVQLAAECVKDADGDADRLMELLSEATADWEIHINDNDEIGYLNETPNGSRYQLNVELKREDGILYADISAMKGEETLYSIQTAEYIGE